MADYDILIVGASTTGCWFAEKMASNGFKVLVIEKQLPDNVSREYDIFHMSEPEMNQFGLPVPEIGSPLREFNFSGSPMCSPYGKHRKKAGNAKIIGLHKHDYIMFMAENAKKKGAEFIYGAPFVDLIFNDKGAVIGAKYENAEGIKEAYAKIVADCSGIPSVARRKLPDTSYVENFKLEPVDILYVILYYFEYNDKSVNPRDLDAFFMQYKSWCAPAGEGYDGLFGIGGCYSYKYAEEVYNNQFMKNVKFPEHTVKKIEKGMTPYHRSVYSFVEDGFIAMGDAAFLTKPTCGEGCTSSLVQGVIAAEVITDLLNKGEELTRKNMWTINKRYMVAQGKEFDSMRPLLMGLIKMSIDEAEYLFENDVIFSNKILGGMDDGLNLSTSDIVDMVKGIVKGVAKKKISTKSVTGLLKGLKQSDAVGKLYDAYPESVSGYVEWKEKADALWDKIGNLSSTCDPAIMKKLGIK